jgi:hypothetical protein
MTSLSEDIGRRGEAMSRLAHALRAYDERQPRRT